MSDPYRTSAEVKIGPKGYSKDQLPFTVFCPKCTSTSLKYEHKTGFREPESIEVLMSTWRWKFKYTVLSDVPPPSKRDLELVWYDRVGTIEGEHLLVRCPCGYNFKCQCADHPKPPAT